MAVVGTRQGWITRRSRGTVIRNAFKDGTRTLENIKYTGCRSASRKSNYLN